MPLKLIDPAERPTDRLCWVVSDGRRGIENQALGLAEAIAERTPIRILRLHTPQGRGGAPRWPSRLNAEALQSVDVSPSDQMWLAMALRGAAPWPDLWIGCGRAAVPYSEAARRWSKRSTFVVQLQDPKRPAGRFDMVIPPLHDEMAAHPNVFPILGSPNSITPERVEEAAEAMPDLAELRQPRVAVLVGGDSKRHRFTHQVEQNLGDALEALSEQGAALLITTSRRSPPGLARALKQRFGSREHVRIWSGEEDGPNPYRAFLGASDVVLATKDSVNMVAEAASAGLPTLLFDVEGDDGKFARFYGALTANGYTRPFTGMLETWPVTPLEETARAADEVIARMGVSGDALQQASA